MTIKRNVSYTQARGCWFCLHVGSVAVFFGTRKPLSAEYRGSNYAFGARLELFTPCRWFRFRGAC